MQSSRPLPIPQISPGDNVESVLVPLIHLRHLYQTNSLARTTTSTLPRIKFIVFPVSIMMLLKHLIRTHWESSQGSDHVTDPWGPTSASI
jgi:hypothetical protein